MLHLRQNVSAIDRLTDALLECSCLQESDSREIIVIDLRPKEIGYKIRYSSSSKEHIRSMVQTCADFEEGLQSLLDRVHYHEGNTIPWFKVHEVWCLISGVFQEHQLQTLQRALELANLPDTDIERFYRASLVGIKPLSPPFSIQSILQHLSDLTIQSESHIYPLLDFALYIAKGTKHEDAWEAIISWLREHIPSVHEEITLEEIERRWIQIHQKDDSVKEGSPALFIVIRQGPQMDGQWKYYTDYFLWENEREISRVIDSQDPQSLEIVQKEISSVLAKVSERLGALYAKLVMEFFLEKNLLNTNIESWQKENIPFRRPLGFHFPVVVRSLDRIKSNEAWSLLENRWILCQQGKISGDFIRICQTDTYSDPDALYNDLIANPSITRIGLPFLPTSTENENTLIDAAVYSGVPIIAWYRKVGNYPEIGQSIRDLLSKCEWVRIAEGIHQLRQQANLDQEHWIHQIALLLDNPKRIPPGIREPRFRAPQ